MKSMKVKKLREVRYICCRSLKAIDIAVELKRWGHNILGCKVLVLKKRS